ncbi:type II secretion system F family protein [Vibrio sp. JC009]|uniref:type II secretion system F family protein n=1 Tax=Vibrio sp. JC009 TaxID=2912314 RepID=UPI0023AF269B|nr:type II secretion system F family protein [Vibrio sp. JC009]WED24571.1 type II secretion system F family protein [Vibrio sp. JC009]
MNNINHYLFIVIATLVSLIIAYLFMKVFDSTNSKLTASRYIGSTENEKKRVKLINKLLDMFNFNQEESRKKLISAGIYSEFFARSYYLFKIVPLVVCVGMAVFGYLTKLISFNTFIMAAGISVVVFVIGLDAYVAARGKKITRRVSARLPFLLDLMNVCVHTGMTIEACLDHLAGELVTVDEHLAYNVKKITERAKLVGIEKAINEFYERIPTNEAQSFVMTLTQSLQYGSSIGPVLAGLASDIRELNMMELEEKIGKMGAKMSIPMIVFIMIPIVILIVAPGFMRMMPDA